MNFNVQIENPSDTHKPWLVMINGLFASLQSWDESVAEISEHFRVLRYDGRGQGKGPRPLGTYSLNDLVADLHGILVEHDIEKVTLLGLSNGGRIALQFGSIYPEMVESIVASDTYAQVSPLLKLKLSSWLEANRKGGPSLRFEVATPWIWGESIVQNKPELIEYYRERAGLEKVHVIEGLIKGAMEDQRIELSSIKCPTLLCVGEEDLLTPPFMHKEMNTQLIDSDLKIVPGGHASLLEAPQSVSQVVLPWLLSRRSRLKGLGVSKDEQRQRN